MSVSHALGDERGDLWRKVVPLLADDHRCIAPDSPLGAHTHPLRDDADLSLPGLARIVADFLDALDLNDVTVVANDTGGAVTHRSWVATPIGIVRSCSRPVTRSCIPAGAATLPEAGVADTGALAAIAHSVRFKPIQRLPLAYGWTTKAPVDREIMRSYTTPIGTIKGTRRDLQRLLRAVDTRYTHDAAESLRTFYKPRWSRGRRRQAVPARARPAARRAAAAGSLRVDRGQPQFVPEEQPERLAELVRSL